MKTILDTGTLNNQKWLKSYHRAIHYVTENLSQVSERTRNYNITEEKETKKGSKEESHFQEIRNMSTEERRHVLYAMNRDNIVATKANQTGP